MIYHVVVSIVLIEIVIEMVKQLTTTHYEITTFWTDGESMTVCYRFYQSGEFHKVGANLN
jgi:hypothetical protein